MQEINRNKGKLELLEEMRRYDTNAALEKVWEKIDEKKTPSLFIRLQRIAAILFLPLLLGFAGSLWFTGKNRADNAMVWQTVQTLPGQKSQVELPDGSRVWLNADSRLTYPVSFGQKSRQVRLSGEAFFDVERDVRKPFTVDMGDLSIRVLGTEFNVNNYPSSTQSQVYLRSGAVEIFAGDPSDNIYLYRMQPGDRVVYDRRQDEIRVGQGISDQCLAWMDGKIVFRDAALADVVQVLNRNFNTRIEILEKEIEQHTLTATFQDESLVQILELLKLSTPIDYRISGREQNEYNIFSKTRVELFTPD